MHDSIEQFEIHMCHGLTTPVEKKQKLLQLREAVNTEIAKTESTPPTATPPPPPPPPKAPQVSLQPGEIYRFELGSKIDHKLTHV